jgi:formylglycine-generating enzyme required for sulfatase activity
MRRVTMCAALVVMSLSASAVAKKKLAVLEFGNGADLKAREVAFMVDVVRGEAVKLDQSKFLIMTKENILEMLPPGIDYAECQGACEVETGRNIGANHLITGEILKIGSKLKVSMRLYDTGSGGLTASETGTAKGVDALEGVLREAAGRLMKPLGHPGVRSNRTFGAGLPTLEDVEDMPLSAGAAPSLGGLADLDVGMLQRYEAASKAEKSGDKSAGEKAAAWRALAAYSSVTPDMRTEAQRRAAHWDGIAKAMVRRCQQTKSVAGRYAADKHKLKQLLALEDSTLPKAKKRALKAEFDEAYDPWKSALKTYEVDCKQLVSLTKAGIELVQIPGGSFMMGSNDGDDDEKPIRRVTVRGFSMSKSEITNAQYQQCVRAGACTAANYDDGSCYIYDYEQGKWAQKVAPSHFRGASQPVVCVDWEQARTFARWAGGRLPTEAEWEHAARSAGKNQKYPWGDSEATCALAVMDSGGSNNSGDGCGRKQTMNVCSKPAGNTQQGLCDMAGNVWEWVEDVYSGYDSAPSDGTARTTGGAKRVVRGGGWLYPAKNLRAALRDWDSPGYRRYSLGFRLAVPSP